MFNKIPIFALLAGLGIAASQYFIWVYAPVEQNMGLVQKIFYTHLPLAWWSMISFFAVFVASVGYLWKRVPGLDHFAAAAAEVGVLFSGLALITGSLWARHSWNVWWTWDPRLSTTLVMWFIYAGYLVVRTMDMSANRRATICAVIGIVAFLDVPLVFYSARLWRSIHPAVFASKGGGLEPEMKLTVIFCIAAFSFLWLALCLARARQIKMKTQLDGLLTQQALEDNA